MPRKKKTEIFVDGHGDVREVIETLPQYEINWDKIKEDVRAAADLVKEGYPPDDGPLTDDQIRQLKESAPKARRSRKK